MILKADVDEAIHAHSAWKVYFYNFLHGKLALDPSHLGTDNHCKFGMWLDCTGRHYLSETDYKEVRALHADFHGVVATVIQKIRAKDFSGARADIAPEGIFVQASALLIQRLLAVSSHFDSKAKCAAAARDPEAEANKYAGGSQPRN